MEAKFGISQADTPAPLWFRRFTNAMILSFLPGYVAVVQAVPMKDSTRNILMVIATAIPFLLKGIGILYGNGQTYQPSNETMDRLKATGLMIIVFLMIGCSPGKKAHSYFAQHPQEFAKDCAGAFPVKDSIGNPMVVYIPAENNDYTNPIDSIKKTTDRLVADINLASRKSLDSCAGSMLYLVERTDKLARQVNDLKSRYAPCKPDTLYQTQTVYRENTARVTALLQDLAVKGESLKQMTADRDGWKAKAKERFWIIAGLITLFGIAVFLRIKGIL